MAEEEKKTAGPLDGIRVIEWAQWIQGPTIGFMLGDLGAEVIKIENPAGGDAGRGMVQMSQMRSARAGHLSRNFFFESVNRNKRSITLDLKHEKGKEVLYRLVEKADIFVHNFRYHVSQRLGIDYETLSRYNPQLIYAEASGLGPKGRERLRPVWEPIVWGKTGWLYFAGAPGDPPYWLVSGPGDSTGGAVTVAAILAALWHRERYGIGQHIDSSLLGSLIYVATYRYTAKLLLGQEFPRRGRDTVVNPLCTFYQCADGRWIFIYMVQSDRYWHDFCRVMGIEHLEKDPKLINLEARSQHPEELIRILDEIFATKPLDEWLELLEKEGDFVYGPIKTVSEAVEDPQILENEYIMDFDHPVFGPIKVVGFPYKFSKTPATLRRAAPELGEHTEEILLESGYTWEEIAELKDMGAIG
jgi:crotonobetainyl-CoA:carnitine CoA-transferase CaiB-like acyl-CoA transferase